MRLLILMAALVLLAAACARADGTPGTETETLSAANTPSTAEAAGAVPQGSATQMMLSTINYLFQGNRDPALIRAMANSGDGSFVPVLVELQLFISVIDPLVADEIDIALNRLTGEGPETLDFADWTGWLGSHPEFTPPQGFAGWKSQLLSFIDPPMSEFLYDGMETRIRLEEIIWGGVPKDGIPDLRDPPVVRAEEASYLGTGERVFGVSINGEHRAYPLRIMNAHEMVNDILGGEPIALAY